MTTLDTHRAHVTSGTGIAGTIISFLGVLASWNDARVTRKSLSKLTARELDDIGLNRGDIEQIAVRGSRY